MQTGARAGALLAAVRGFDRAWALAPLLAGLGCLARAGPEPEPANSGPAVFLEAVPQLSTAELFGALRELGVDVWVADDMRVGARLHDARNFAAVCELLAALDHEIESVDLAYLPVADLGPIVRLRSTERLDLTGARAELRPLRHLSRLRSLSLAHTDFDSLAPIAELAALEQLDLRDARVDLTAVGQLPNLRRLDLRAARTAPAGFKVRDGDGIELCALRSSTTLEQLDLSQTKVRDWTSLRSLWTLRQLDLSYTNFAELWLLDGFDELESLVLRRTAIADVTPLVRLSSLRVVDLRDCELVSDAELDRLQALRPRLEILR